MAQSVLMQLLLEIRQFQASLQRAQMAMQTATNRMSRQAQRTGRAMGEASKKATGFAGAIEFLKKRVIGAGLFFAAFYQGLILLRQTVGEVITEFFDLDDSLRRVQSITKESDASIGRLREKLLGLARQGALFNQTAADVADSMYTIAQAGFSTSDSLEIAKLAAEGAAVGFTTAEIAAKVLVNVLKAYDMPVSKARDVMDILFQTVDTGIVTFEDLSNNLGRVLASASALEVPLTDVTGAVATLTLRGFSAAQAMTSVNRILMTFLRPSQRASKAAAALGIELNRDTIAAEGLVPLLNQMWVASGQNANKFAEMFDRIQSTRGALSLMSDDGVLLTQVMEDMGIATEDAGAMAAAMEHRAKSLKFQMSILRVQMLALITQAVQPLTDSIGLHLRKINDILAGRNAFFNYFGDLKSLVLAVVAAFIYMKRTAIAGIFVSIGSAMLSFVSGLRMAVRMLGVMQTAIQATAMVLKTIAPLLIFLAVFSLAKFAGKFDPIAKASKRAQERLAEFNDELARQKMLLEEGIITPEQFGLRAWNVAIDTIETTIREDFEPAMNSAMMHFDSFGEAVAALGGGVRRVFTGDFRDSAQVVRDDFNKALEETIDRLRETGASAGDIEEVAKQMRILAMTTEGEFMRDLFTQAAMDVQTLANETAEIEGDLISAAKAGDGLTETFGETVITAADIKKGIEDWIKPIAEAKALTEEILGLTTEQDIVYRTLIEPIEDRIALRNIAIADAKVKQRDVATEMKKPLDEIEEGENAIFDYIEAGVGALEEQNAADSELIDKLNVRLEYEKEIGETQAANNVLADLRNGKYDELTGELMPEQLRLLDRVVHDFLPRGGEGIRDWILLTASLGQTLDEEVLAALVLIVETGKDSKLAMDVTDALANLGLVEQRIARMTGQAVHIRFVEEQRSRARGFQHGIRNFMGGLMRVGEAGEELIQLPRGSNVIPHGNIGPALRDQARQRPALAATAEVNITTSLLKDWLELKRMLLKKVDQKLDDAAARVGMSKPRFGTWGAGQPRI